MKIINFLVFVLFIATTKLLLAIPMENELNPNAALSRPSSREQMSCNSREESMKATITDTTSAAVPPRSTELAVSEDEDEDSDLSSITTEERSSDLSFAEQQPVSELSEQELLDKAEEQRKCVKAYRDASVTASASQNREESDYFDTAVFYAKASAEQYEKAVEYLKQIRESSFSATLDFTELLRKASKQAQLAATYHARTLEPFESGELSQFNYLSKAAFYHQSSAEQFSIAAQYWKQATEARAAGASLPAKNFNKAFKQAQIAADHYAEAAILLEGGKNKHTKKDDLASIAKRRSNQYAEKAVSLKSTEAPTIAPIAATEQEEKLSVDNDRAAVVKFSDEIEAGIAPKSSIRKAASKYRQSQYITPEAACLARSKEITSHAETLEKQAKKDLEDMKTMGLPNYYEVLYKAVHSCNDVIQAAHQATEAWIQTAKMHSLLPGPQLGSRLKNTWSKKTNDWKEQRNELIQELLTKAEEVSNRGTKPIHSIFYKCYYKSLFISILSYESSS